MADKFLEKLNGAEKNVPLKDFTTYKIGGPAKYFFDAKNKEDLMFALKVAKNFKLPVFILGGGSNLLVSDKGFKGLVIKIDISGVKFQNKKVFVGAGMELSKLAYLSAEKGLSGLEWAAGIPGATIGGAIYGHAQAFGVKISDAVKEVVAINSKTLKIETFTKEQCRFSLKNSIFKKNKNLVIVSAVLDFKGKNADEIKNKIKEFLEHRKTRHPINFPSAGSTFVNPEIKGETIPAGALIAKCGLAGKKIGKAQISEMHANFIVNLGGAKSKDVLALMNLARKEVKNKFKINLETEVQFVGFKK
ncbi:MAG: UDP-N-acetylmuramate dehydrogenase [Candidatus Staskawiczbacteria bacterium]|jgi:UDP-N-acetylmuramate dehydrogenase